MRRPLIRINFAHAAIVDPVIQTKPVGKSEPLDIEIRFDGDQLFDEQSVGAVVLDQQQ